MLKYKPRDRRDTALLTEILRELDLVTQARRTRLVFASGVVPVVIWLVLFGGACLTVSFTFFFGAENLGAQSLMAGALALLIFSGLLIIVAIDHPFAGTVKVGPEALSSVLEDFGG
jgi:Na+/melibiose symporter-like transporter